MKTLRNIYFAIFDCHLTYSCVIRLIIIRKKALRIMNFKDQLFHSSSFFSENNILKFGDKITSENILSVDQSINGQGSPIFRSNHPEVFLEKGILKICSKFTEHPCRSVISIKLLCKYFQEICIDTKLAGL